MSIVECKSPLPTSLSGFDDAQWEAYLKTIDEEIEFLLEWGRSIEDRNKR